MWDRRRIQEYSQRQEEIPLPNSFNFFLCSHLGDEHPCWVPGAEQWQFSQFFKKVISLAKWPTSVWTLRYVSNDTQTTYRKQNTHHWAGLLTCQIELEWKVSAWPLSLFFRKTFSLPLFFPKFVVLGPEHSEKADKRNKQKTIFKTSENGLLLKRFCMKRVCIQMSSASTICSI